MSESSVSENSGGWVKFHRAALQKGWLSDHKLWTFWSYCLLKASYKETTFLVSGQQVHLSPGQFWMGRKKAAEDLRMSEQGVRTCVEKLKKFGNITIRATNKGSLISITNWRLYQGQQEEGNQQTNSFVTNEPPTVNHIQKYKEGKEQPSMANLSFETEIEKPATRSQSDGMPGLDPDVKAVMDHFCAVCKDVLEIEPATAPADAKMTALALKERPVDHLKNHIEFCVDLFKEKGFGVALTSCYKPYFHNLYQQKWKQLQHNYHGFETPPLDRKWWRL